MTFGQAAQMGQTASWIRTGIALAMLAPTGLAAAEDVSVYATERQLTTTAQGHILTNSGVWSHDSKWINYDVRSDPAGTLFDGTKIERINVETGEIELLFEAKNGACVGVVTASPVDDRVVFIHGPEHPGSDWSYGQDRRRGVLVDVKHPGVATNLDARDLTPPFTPGALRGGSHVHVFSGDGQWVSFTYNDHVLSTLEETSRERDLDQRNVGVSIPIGPVRVATGHKRNHDGSCFSVLVTRTTNQPEPGSDEISRAFEDAWVGTNGYLRPDGTRQKRAIAFQGEVTTRTGEMIVEVFLVDLPDDLTKPGDGPLEGTMHRRPMPPAGTQQRRLTFTAGRKHPGLQGPRHWLRSSPDGSKIAFLMRDDAGIVQIWTVSPIGGEPVQVTANDADVASAFSWSPDGRSIACVIDGSIFVTEVVTGRSRRVTRRAADGTVPRPEACVFSPDGRQIAYLRPVEVDGRIWNQVFCVSVDQLPTAGEARP